MSKKIAIGSDHAGFEYKTALVEFLTAEGYEVSDFGPATGDSVDYPDFAHPVASSVEGGDSELGVLICGSANGVAITANKHQGIRAAIAWQNEISALARQHNNANIVCIPARFIDLDLAKKIVKTFVTTEFEGGRHATRVNKIACN
ncbi:ribose 5-phosphate isomerase B [Sphingobacterium allocomposti]|jgi:ribose 5-phosphate isomerase B|uniref:Ribose 5-phosphate isomerase B n=1 Tax=Sphingobacterium allocomposti TaxID=415956 RepID=A0A5S5DSK0_9SPHI|nr:ribose 5-phosphate isomerase B [Sphingobacterium composti Yoo et al. 2007 non Ten et al. 2007]TYP98664.1 ribose 5-phosphate isomerase B [Sphingobacterium composti Yoo et al. 2007 non Ten et al. 2007]HLS96243.1 ribose 5-phosphate isomerase B [Sphingobacterium sp.]